MLKKNKLKVIISSIIVLLPMIFGIIVWNDLPNTITTHFGIDGIANGFSGKAFAVFALPAILLVLHSICLLFTLLDKKQKEQNQKALGIIFWIIPIISLLVNGIMYRTAFGKGVDVTLIVPVLLGILFVFIGNYMPKTKQNRTLGIKVKWALRNEENWNKTHRFGGKVWVICGFAILLCIVLPFKAFAIAIPCVIAAAIILPTAYSYLIYRKHKKKGIVYDIKPVSKTQRITAGISLVIVAIILIGAAILMFTGNIEVKYKAASFKINATYWTDIEVDYSEINNIEYRNNLDVGARTSGFGSARLLMGIFQNEEFGSYTLYAYVGAKEYVVLTSGEKTLVIEMSEAKKTQAIYDTISSKID